VIAELDVFFRINGFTARLLPDNNVSEVPGDVEKDWDVMGAPST
jgi:hypothetical protein